MKKLIILSLAAILITLACVEIPDFYICPDSNGDIGLRIRPVGSTTPYKASTGDHGVLHEGQEKTLYGFDYETGWIKFGGEKTYLNTMIVNECLFMAEPIVIPVAEEKSMPQLDIFDMFPYLKIRFGGLRE